MNDWRDVELGDLIILHNRRRVPLSRLVRTQRQGPYRYYGAQGVIDHIDAYLFDGEYILVAEDGENLRSRKQPIANLVSGRFWVNNHAHIIAPRNDVADIRFLLHAINHSDLAGRVTGAAQPKLTKDNLEHLTVRCPPLGVQRRIAALLCAFDELIDINARRIELLEDLASSLYREWFVRFRFPGHEEAEFVDSEMGSLPAGWRATRLGEVVKLRYGKALPARFRRPGIVSVVSSAGVVDEHDVAVAEGPGVVIGRKGNVGSVWWIDGDYFPIDTTYYVETDQPLGLIYWQVADLNFVDSHAAVPGLSRDQANALPVLLPDQIHSAAFDASHRTLFGQIATLSAQSGLHTATRDLLVDRLITGRLDISDLDLRDLLPSGAA
jgi:type I restriction enzyme S subunit